MFSNETTQILAALVLVATVCAFIAWFIVSKRQTRFTYTQFTLMIVSKVLARMMWRGDISGRFPLDQQTGGILICNHRSAFDPFLIQLSLDRVVHWMVAREYVEFAGYAWFFKIAQSIPVGRAGVDVTATRLAIRYASEGGLIGMFPEGRINTTDQVLLPGRPGVALVALKARVPVVPLYIEGSPTAKSTLGALIKPAHAKIKIGAPLDISEFYGRENEREVLEELTRRFMTEIGKLAGDEAYVPTIAGRKWLPE